MKRVLFLAYHFPPVGGSGVQRNAKFARYLPEYGYEPVVVTGPGESAGRWTPPDPSLLADVPLTTAVHRVPRPEPPVSEGRKNRVERLLFRRSAFVRWWVRAAYEAGRKLGPGVELVYASLGPYETAEAAAALASALGRPWVADLQDPWALDEIWLYPTGAHRLRDRARMRRLLRSAAAVVMNTREAARRVSRDFPELASRVVTIPNGFDAEDFAGPAPARNGGPFRIVHTGYLYTAAGLQHRRTARLRRLLGGSSAPVDILPRSHVYLVRALASLLATEPGLARELELHLAGVLSAVDLEVAAELPVVRAPGYLPHADAVELIRSADLLFLPLHDVPPGDRVAVVPGKTYEYLASGRPILGAVPDGDARDLLLEAGTAAICAPTDWNAMAQIVRAEVERRANGEPVPEPRPDVLARYERRRLTADLAGIFDRLLGS